MTDLLKNISKENIQEVLNSRNWEKILEYNKSSLDLINQHNLSSKLKKIEKLI